MKEIFKKTIEVNMLSGVICDICGRKVDIENYEEYVTIEHVGGYGSLIGDGNQLSMDVCESCLIMNFSDQIDKCINRDFENE